MKKSIFIIAAMLLLAIAIPSASAACTFNSGTVQFADGGEFLSGTHSLLWDSGVCDANETVSVSYSSTGCSGVFNSIVTCTGVDATDGTCSWDTTTVADGITYCLRVQQDGFTFNDFSNGNFTIDNTPPSLSETDITVDTSACTGTGGTCRIGDTVTISVDLQGDVSINDINFTNSATGDVLFDLASAVDADFSGASGAVWNATFTIADSTTTSGSADNAAYGIEVTIGDFSGNTQTLTSATSTLDVDNERPALAETVISILGSSDDTIAGSAGFYNPTDTLDVAVDHSTLTDRAASPVDFNGSSATDLGTVTQVFNDAGTSPDVTGADTISSAQITIAAGTVDDSAYGLTVTITDDAGNVQVLQAATNTVNVDNEVPVIGTAGTINVSTNNFGPASGAAIGDGITYLAGVENTNDTVTWRIDLTSIGLGASVANNAEQIVVADDDDDAARTFTETVTDDAGNVVMGTTGSLDIDNVAPIITVAGTASVTSEPVLADGIAAVGEEITYAIGTLSAADGDTWTVDLSAYGLNATTAPGAVTVVADDDDGAFSATETVTDNAGNTVSGAVTTGFNIDNELPTITGAGSVTVSTNLIGGANAAVGDNITYATGTEGTGDALIGWTVDLSTIGLGATVAPATPQTVVADDDDNASMTYLETVTDDAGNTASGQTNSLDIDNEIPVITDGGNVNISTDGGVTSVAALNDGTNVDAISYLGGTDSTGDTITWTIDFNTVLGYGSSSAAVNTPLSLQAGTTDNAATTFSIVATDDAGNAVGGTSNSVSIDDVAPVISVAGTVTLSAEVTVDGLAAVGDTLTYADGTVGAADGDSWSVNLSTYGLSGTQAAGSTVVVADDDDGAFSATETLIDDAGNYVTGLVTLVGFSAIDNELPVFEATSSDMAIYTEGDDIDLTSDMSQTTPEIASVTADLSVLDSALSSTFALSDGDTDTVFQGTSSPLNRNTMSPDGSYLIVLTATDNAGNTATNNTINVTLFLDRPVPSAVEVTPNPTRGTNTFATALVTDDTAVLGAEYMIKNSSDDTVKAWTSIATPEDGSYGDANETLEVDISADLTGLPEGVYSIHFRATDANGLGPSVATTFTVDADAPTPESLAADIAAVNGSLTNLTGRVSQTESDIATLQTNVSTLTGDVADLQQNVTDLQNGVNNNSANIASNLAAINAVDSRVDSVNATATSNAATIATHVTQISALQASVTSLNSSIQSLSGDVSTLQSTVVSLQAQINAVNATIQSQASTISSIQTSVSGLQTNVSTLQSQMTTIIGFTITTNTINSWTSKAGTLSVNTSLSATCTYYEAFDTSNAGSLTAVGNTHSAAESWTADRDHTIWIVTCTDSTYGYTQDLAVGVVEPVSVSPFYAVDYPGTDSGFTASRKGDLISNFELAGISGWGSGFNLDDFLTSSAGDVADRLTTSDVNGVWAYNSGTGLWTTVSTPFDTWDFNNHSTSFIGYYVFDFASTAQGKSIRHS